MDSAAEKRTKYQLEIYIPLRACRLKYGLIYRILKNEAYVAAKKGGIIINLKCLKVKKGLLGKRLYTLNNKLEKSIENVKI